MRLKVQGKTEEIRDLILKARDKARTEKGKTPDSMVPITVEWPVHCTVGPGLEGAIACESRVGYVNGSQGTLSYRGYDIFDLCAYSNFEEVSYLLLRDCLPTKRQLDAFRARLVEYMNIPDTLRHLMNFDVEKMHTMAALRLGANMMRYDQTELDKEESKPDVSKAIGLDEDSIPMETIPRGEEHAIYEFKTAAPLMRNFDTCCRMIASVASMAAAIARLRKDELPIAPDPDLSFAGNFLYMMTGKRPAPVEERIMDVCLILQADHGINASTFAALVVASTLSDIYSSVSAGIGALTGPLHGGANEQVVAMLRHIGSPDNVKDWYERAQARKAKIMGMGHRVYKVYDPRARILGPIVGYLARRNKDTAVLYRTAKALENEAAGTLGRKGIFPNVDFYSGMVYSALGIPDEMFTPIFAVSRVSGWTARILEYLKDNRIFRPRIMYSGPIGKEYVPMGRKRTGLADRSKSKTARTIDG
jgi:citrate synthase